MGTPLVRVLGQHSAKVEMAKAACIDIDVTHRQTAMIVAIRLEEFKIPRVIRHGHFARNCVAPAVRAALR